MTLDFGALRAQGRAIEEHALFREIDSAAKASEVNSEQISAAIGELLADELIPDGEKARELLAIAAGLGIGVHAAGLPVVRGVTRAMPGLNRPEVQGLAEGLAAPIRVAVLHAPLVSPAIMAGIAAQADALAASADASMGDAPLLAAQVEEEIAARQEEAVYAAELDEAAHHEEEIAHERPLPSSAPDADHGEQALPSEAHPAAKRRPSLILRMLARK